MQVNVFHHFGPSGRRRLSLGAQVSTGVIRRVVRPALRRLPVTPATIAAGRSIDVAARLLPVRTAGVFTSTVRFGSISYRITQPRTAATPDLGDGFLLYFHGGGFVAGGYNTHRRLVAALAEQTNLPVVAIRYRYLPRTPVRDSVRECLTAYRTLLEAYAVDPDTVAFVGDSAGGFLAVATALAANEAALPLPGAVVAISGWLDLDTAPKLSHHNALTEAYLPTAAFTQITQLGCLVNGVLDARLSPVNADVSVLPPTYLLACAEEFLRLDSEVMAQKLAAVGVEHELHLWYGLVHAFPTLFPYLPESRAAIASIAQFLRTHIRTAAAPVAA